MCRRLFCVSVVLTPETDFVCLFVHTFFCPVCFCDCRAAATEVDCDVHKRGGYA